MIFFIIIIIIPIGTNMGSLNSSLKEGPLLGEQVITLSFEGKDGDFVVVMTEKLFFHTFLTAYEKHFPDRNTHIVEVIKRYLSPDSLLRNAMVVEAASVMLEAFWLKFYRLVNKDWMSQKQDKLPYYSLDHYFTREVMCEYMN